MKEFHSMRATGPPDPLLDSELVQEEPRIQVEESEGKIEISFSFPGFFRSDDAREVRGRTINFSQINMASTGFLAQNGRPLLPSFNRYVQIPANADVSVTTQKGEPIVFDNILVLPAQEHVSDAALDEPEFEYDRAFYAKDALYPRRIVEKKGPFLIDDYHAMLLTVVPFQYNPKKKRLIGYGDLKVTLKIKPKPKADQDTTFDPTLNREGFGNLFLNPGRSINERLNFRSARGERRMLHRRRGPEFLIIYADPFAKAAKKLEHWKRKRGLRTKSVPISMVGNSVSSIKKYIREKRAFPSRLRYVLLLGDVETIPAERVRGGPWGDNTTDYYYATPRDATSWTDVVTPWLAIGRIPVQTVVDANAVVRQIIRYEKSPPRRRSYYKKLTVAGFFQGRGKATRAYVKTMEDIRYYMLTLGFDVERVYVSQFPEVEYYIDDTPVPADVKAAMISPPAATAKLVNATNEGRLITGHRDHGDRPGWLHPPFTVTDLNSVTTRVPSIFHSINCLTGMFDIPGGTECFAEELLRINGGAPSLIAATRVSQTWLNNDLIKALFDGTWGGLLPTFPGGMASYPIRHNRLGDILNYAKAYLPLTLSGSTQYVKDHLEIYHVVGDPTLEVWRTAPRMQKMKCWIAGKSLHIKLSELPADAMLTIWHGDNLLRRIRPRSGHTRIALPRERMLSTEMLLRRKKIIVCFSAPDYRFRQVAPQRRPVAESLHFDWTKAKVKKIDRRWKIAVGDTVLMDFGNKEDEARDALKIIRHYKLDQRCVIGSPKPSMEYFLADGAAPTGKLRGEDSIAFEAGKLQVRKVDGRWKLAENGKHILDFGDKEEEARAAQQIIDRYDFDHICYVGRPRPSMTYFHH